MIENFHIWGKLLKSLEDLASAFSILPAKTPHKINHAIDEDGNQWYLKPLRKFQNKTTRITSFVYGVLAGRHYNRAWAIRSTFSEELENFHVFFEREILPFGRN